MITAYIITHNRCDLLKKAILSVLNQTKAVSELIIIDDSSTDDTETVIASFKEGSAVPIVYYKFSVNVGSCLARNKAIELAKYEFIAGLDDDDEWTSNRMEKLSSEYDTDLSFVTSRNRIISPKNKRHTTYSPKLVCLKDILSLNYTGNQLFTETYKLRAINGFDESLKSAQDYDLNLRLIERFGCAKVLKEPLQIIYQNHGEKSITANSYFGYLSFYFKHYHKFSNKNKIVQIFRISQVRGRNIPLHYLLYSPDLMTFLKMTKFYFLRIFNKNHKTF